MRNICRLFNKRFFSAALAVLFICGAVSGCSVSNDANTQNKLEFNSLDDVKDITDDEIAAVEKLRQSGVTFVYGAVQSTEAFLSYDGSISGFSALMCDWLTALFEIEFTPEIYESDGLTDGLQTGSIDFTGEFEPTEGYYSTAIAGRRLIAISLEENTRLTKTADSPIYVFLSGSNTNQKLSAFETEYEAVYADDYAAAYETLKNGQADAFFTDETAEYAFDGYDGLKIEKYFPLVYNYVSLSTQNPELEPIITVVQKTLLQGAAQRLTELYNDGYGEYMRYKLYTTLTDEEREYIQSNQTVAFAAEINNYPVSFYDTHEGEWQGIAIDVVSEIESLTGMEFKIVNDSKSEFTELFNLLRTGEASVLTELIYTEERAETFTWPKIDYMTDNFALISKSEHRNIAENEIPYVRVGVGQNTAHAARFKEWFPDHANLTEYENTTAAFNALERGEVDMVMAGQHQLLGLTNYREMVGYKLNVVFDYSFASTFGINGDETVLCSVMDKALSLIDIETISGQWMRKTYDYRVKVAQAQIPGLIGATALFVVVSFLFILFMRKQKAGKTLEATVQSRTSELEKCRENLEIALDTAENANRTKSVFLANMSHEIRTPMNAVIGMSELLLQEKLNNRQTGYVNDINLSAHSLLSIINDILDMSKIEAGKLELAPVDYDFYVFIDNIESMFTFVASKKNLEFMCEGEKSVPRYLFGDDIRLRQVITNLCGNAVKFTDEGYIRLKVSVENGMITFEVSDTGKGIYKEDLPKLFSAFQQADTLKNRGITGTGLGLSISKSFVEMMGGSIGVESEYGQGSVFTVTIPLVEGSNDNIYSKEAENETIGMSAPNANILVVDDNEFNLKVASGLLNLSNIEAHTASSGKKAIEMIEQTDYDLVFMDHMMPEMDGIETVSRIRALGGKYESLPIVALTANVIKGAKEMFMENGFNGFVSKPIAIRELNHSLRELLPADKVKLEFKKSDAESQKVGGDFIEKMSKIAEIDENNGLARVSGSEVMYYDSLKLFHKRLRSECDNMTTHLNNGDLRGFSILIHAMKSILASIGAMELSEKAAKLEAASKGGEVDYCEQQFPPFKETMLSLYDDLTEVFPAVEKSAEKEKGEPARLKETLQKAIAAADSFDDDAGVQAINDLLAFDFGGEVNALLEKALTEFENFEFDAAKLVINEIV